MFGRKKYEEPEEVVIQKPEPVKEEPKFVPSRVTTIGKDVTLVGDFVTSDTLEIKGTLKGNIISDVKVHVAQGGILNGDAKASDILVDGDVDGTIIINNVAEISNTGSMQGNLETKTFVTNRESHFEGRLSIIPDRMKHREEPAPEPDSSAIQY